MFFQTGNALKSILLEGKVAPQATDEVAKKPLILDFDLLDDAFAAL